MSGRPDQRILVVIPAWNEAGAIAGTIAEVRASQPDLDILVVDDGSGDGTAAVARSAGAQVVRLPFNLGVGGAMRTGYRYADAQTTTSSSRSTPTASTTRLPPAAPRRARRLRRRHRRPVRR